MKQVSINTDSYTKQSIKLDDNVYFFELFWTGLFWMLTIWFNDNKRVLLRTKVVANFPLLNSSNRSRLTRINGQVVNFRGEVVITLTENRDLQKDDFKEGRAQLFFIEGDELDDFLAKSYKS